MTKKRIVKDYDQIPDDVKLKLKQEYPHGFSEHLIKFTNAQGKMVSALPFETDEIYYLIRMTVEEAIQIVEEDEDYDDFGNLDMKIPVDSEGMDTEIESGIDPELDELKEEAEYEDDYDDDNGYDDEDFEDEDEDDDDY